MTLVFSATDSGGSGVAGLKCADNGKTATPGIVYTPLSKAGGTLSIARNGTHAVSCIAVDGAGNESAPVNVTVKIDVVAPTTTVLEASPST